MSVRVEPGQIWQTPFCMYSAEILEVQDDGTVLSRVEDVETGKTTLQLGSASTLEEMWVLA